MSDTISVSIDQMGNNVAVIVPPKRIISLVPSQTELLADLGLDDTVVGITKFCVHPERWKIKQRIGGTKQFNLDIIDQLAPDLIIGNKEENYQEGIKALQRKYPVWMSDINTIADALAMIQSVGLLTERQRRANEICASIGDAFQRIRKFKQMRVLYLIWRKPWMAAGRNTFIDHILSTIGLINAVELNRYPELRETEIRKINPDIVLLSSEPYPFEENHREELKTICPTAKIILVDGEMFSWYGPRLIKAPAYFETLSF